MTEYCCETFEHATHNGTDSEGWGSAVHWGHGLRDRWLIGCVPKPLCYCPWCGLPLDPGDNTEDQREDDQ